MRSQKGIGLVRLVIFIICMMLLLGVTTYVVMQDNGIYEREFKPLIENHTEKDAEKTEENKATQE